MHLAKKMGPLANDRFKTRILPLRNQVLLPVLTIACQSSSSRQQPIELKRQLLEGPA
jgi:hypothetical protein